MKARKNPNQRVSGDGEGGSCEGPTTEYARWDKYAHTKGQEHPATCMAGFVRVFGQLFEDLTMATIAVIAMAMDSINKGIPDK
jgi:hypothetical protein